MLVSTTATLHVERSPSGRRRSFVPVDTHVPGLEQSGLSDRFRSWQGRSGRHYMFTVYSRDALREELAPGFMFADAVVIVVERSGDGYRNVSAVACVGRLPDLFFGALLARLDEVAEIHIHLLGRTRDERDAIVADLRRH